MQGKLTKQLPEDGSAEVLIEEIKAEKEKVIKNGLVKKQKIIEPLADTPFDIPESWRWVQLSDLVYVYSGLAYNKKDLDEKIVDEVTVFRGGNISNMSYCFKADDVKIDKKFIPKDELFLRKNQLITPAVTSQSNLGKIARIDIDYPNVVAGGFVLNIVPYIISDDIFSKLFCYFFSSPFYKERCNEIANKSGQAFYNLNRTKLQESAFPLPPLDEQKRIVEKVDELMARVADLGQSADALASLKKAFPDDIKASLLQAAMQGKLTKQLPEDGSAEDLLEEIKAEKEKLIAEGKVKKQKPLAPITDDEIPFSIPDNWKWVRLGEIGDWGSGATPPKTRPEYYKDGNIKWLLTGDLNNGLITDTTGRITELALEKTSVRLNPIGSVLIAMYGATIGKLGVLDVEATTNQACCACVPYDGIYNWYLFYFLMQHKATFISEGAGAAQPNISKEKIIATIMPLPPLAEQKRIVERLNTLMQNINVVGDLIASE
ncbi:restriction endonuclease subunit S [Candidatus Saccharibacteria bacterium]|nr:restriction endonuclease subunit S [Candidatus Saccharibacteria bacterium]